MSRHSPAARVIWHDTLGSTNDEARRLARNGASEGTVVCARQQTAGRGRRGRPWVSPPGNLYASVITRPVCSAGEATRLGFVAAVSLGDALRAKLPATEELSYKWPNDVLMHGRKLAGILLESETGAGGELAFVVIGVGVNLVSSPREVEFPATSAAEEGFVPPFPATLLEEFMKHLRVWLKRWRMAGFAPVRTAWLAGATPLGELIRVRLENGTLCGRFVDIDHEGALLLETAEERRRISAGEIFPVDPDMINAARD